jgi:hypothetical protein
MTTRRAADGGLDEKLCAACGRRITWRKKWARTWESVRYCSDACRRGRVGDVDRALERAIVTLLEQRPRGATICPSEAARQVRPADWRDWLEPTRRAGRRLANAGLLNWTQGGRVVDPSTARGPVRFLARARAGGY